MLILNFQRLIFVICVWFIDLGDSFWIKRIKIDQPLQQNRSNWFGYQATVASNYSLSYNRQIFDNDWLSDQSESASRAKSLNKIPYFINQASRWSDKNKHSDLAEKKSKEQSEASLQKVHDRSIDSVAPLSKREKSNTTWTMNSSTSFAIIIAVSLGFIVALFAVAYYQQQLDQQQQLQQQQPKSDDNDADDRERRRRRHRRRRRREQANESNQSHLSEAKKLLRTRLYVVKRYIPCHFDLGLPCPEKHAKKHNDLNDNGQDVNSTSSLWSATPVSIVHEPRDINDNNDNKSKLLRPTTNEVAKQTCAK